MVISFANDRVEPLEIQGRRLHGGTLDDEQTVSGRDADAWPGPEEPILPRSRDRFHSLEPTFIGVNGPGHPAAKKFLFYRGVGTFPPPVTVRAEGGGKVRVRNAAGGKVTGMVLVTVHDGRIAFRAVNDLDVGAEAVATLPDTSAGPAEPGAASGEGVGRRGSVRTGGSAGHGKTWDHSLVPRGGHPLALYRAADEDRRADASHGQPRAPTKVVRVIVGRHDFLTPELEAAVQPQVARLRTGPAEQAAARSELDKIGRFSAQAVRLAEERLAKEKK